MYENEIFLVIRLIIIDCVTSHFNNFFSYLQASKFTLKQVFKTFNVKKSNDFVQTHLFDEGRLYLDEFLSALLRQLADELPNSVVKCLQTAVNYLHSARDDMKQHPPLLIGEFNSR